MASGRHRATRECALAIGAMLLLFAYDAIAAVGTKPSVATLHVPAAAPRHPKLLQSRSTRRAAPLGGQQRPGKTITVRAARPAHGSLPR
jgi:hypothetical protein